jgi:hypothetical protein
VSFFRFQNSRDRHLRKNGSPERWMGIDATHWRSSFGPFDLLAGFQPNGGTSGSVILANAGIQKCGVGNLVNGLGSRVRGNDEELSFLVGLV